DGGVLVRHLFEMVDDVEIHVAGEEVLAYPLRDVGVDLVLIEDASLLVLLEHRPIGIDPPDPNARILLLQIPSYAADGAAGAHTADQVGDAAVGLLPDLGAGLLVVRRRIGQVVVLIGLPGVWNLALETRRNRIVRPRVFRIDVGWTDDHLRPERLEGIHLLLGLLVRRREDALIAFDDGHNGETHPGVAGSTFDNGASGLKLSFPFGILDHA